MDKFTDADALTRRRFIASLGCGTAAGLGLMAAPAGAGKDQPVTEPFALTHGPFLQAPGAEEMTITWHTNRPGVSQVRYGTGDTLDQLAIPSKDGLIPNDSTCHAVRLTGLTPGKTYRYQAVTREFKGYMTAYIAAFGDAVESAAFSFTTMDAGKKNHSFLIWNDIHDDHKRLEGMFKEAAWDGVDFVAFNGDIINDFLRPDQPFKGFLDASIRQFAQTTPMVYVRGNHETRGPMARRFGDYFPGRNGRFYYSFDHGPVHYVVLDSGEDKPDGNKEYAGLVNFGPYREEQAAWLREDLNSEAARQARFRVVFSHQPPLGGESDQSYAGNELRRLWRPIINEARVQLWLCGHTHDFGQVKPGQDEGNAYHLIINPSDGTLCVSVSPEALQVTVMRQGKLLTDTKIAVSS